MNAPSSIGGIVLCGGKSSRMGLPKALLPFGNETMLNRIVRLLNSVVDPIVVVAAPDQEISGLPSDVILARDRRTAQGPLEGILAGLTAIAPQAAAAYVTSCDVPRLVPAFVARLVALLDDEEIAVPFDGEFQHPLSAVYRVSVVDRIESLLATNRLRPAFLFDIARTKRIATAELRDVDPELSSLQNLNHPEDYLAALGAAGFEVSPEIVAQLRRG